MSSKQGSRVHVAIRLRPASKAHGDECKEPCVRGVSDKSLEIWNWRDSEQSLHFDFDAYLDSKASQKTVYDRCVKPLLSHALNGQNASVFAYGPTGTGKTYTMLGTEDDPGVIPRSLNHIFNVISQDKPQGEGTWTYAVSFSYLEIYQEKIYDLLEPKGHDLTIREDRNRNIFIPKLAEKTINNFNEFAKYFIPASRNRTTAATKLNSRSSRSHSILLLKIIKERRDGSKHHIQTGKLYLIDLAGSENNKKTGNQGIRLKESGAINTSLFVLGQVVDALNQRLPRIPYRDSKLTRLLQDSLGGSSHACMITNIAPEEKNYMDTYTTLHFAAKSKQIINKPFTRETTQTIIAPPITTGQSRKRQHEDVQSSSRNTKTRALDVNGKPVADTKDTMLKPLLDRQANFEASVHQRLQSLEQNLLKQMKKTKTQAKTPTSKKLLSEVKSMRRELSSMNQKKEIKPDRRSTFTLNDPNRPAPPQAVVKPISVSTGQTTCNVPPSHSKDRNTKPMIQDKENTTKSSNKSNAVKFVKAVSKSTSSSTGGTEMTENQWHLKLDPEFQAKHRNKILKTLNEGTVKQLKSLQSVGEKRAQLIYSWRQAFGAYTQIEDLYKVNGLPSKTVDNIIGNNLLYTPA
ncbi:kinesin-like protein KIF22 isoform X2 [Lytechinus variegatus]|nr:kinesin-like protein KIF22 isoform X2 [Lytechinus variegatus]XP_041457176.1 kinesin-like protein KIF22 isoform X2 [Lytechinus variegatus]XP_041457177.1 kinesin-like protein KIF22 isoform X2 [Lytechinus variegatus]